MTDIIKELEESGELEKFEKNEKINFERKEDRGITELGRGGEGTVYAATNRHNRPIAVKFINEEDYRGNEGVDNIIDVIGGGFTKKNGTSYIETTNNEYEVELYKRRKCDLTKHLNSENPVNIFSIIVPAVIALDNMHKQNLYHCDIKPQNIFINSEDRSKISDFGGAVNDKDGIPTTLTFEYFPENKYNLEDVDFYSFGLTMSELITGKSLQDNAKTQYGTDKIEGEHITFLSAKNINMKRLLPRIVMNDNAEKIAKIKLAELINGMIRYKHEDRLSTDEIKEKIVDFVFFVKNNSKNKEGDFIDFETDLKLKSKDLYSLGIINDDIINKERTRYLNRLNLLINYQNETDETKKEEIKNSSYLRTALKGIDKFSPSAEKCLNYINQCMKENNNISEKDKDFIVNSLVNVEEKEKMIVLELLSNIKSLEERRAELKSKDPNSEYFFKVKNYKNSSKSFMEHYENEAKKGNPSAMYYYGLKLIKNGRDEDGENYIKMAANHNYTEAENKYLEILKNKNNEIEVIDFCTKMAINGKINGINELKEIVDKGNKDAIYQYALLLDNVIKGKKSKEDKEKATKYFKILANDGNVDAMYRYAKNINNSNKNEATKYFKMAADKGNADAMYEYAVNIHSTSNKESLKYFRMSLEKGINNRLPLAFLEGEIDDENPEALYQYSLLLNCPGNCKFIRQNKEEAVKYFKMAADKGGAEYRYKYALKLLEEGKEKDAMIYLTPNKNNITNKSKSKQLLLKLKTEQRKKEWLEKRENLKKNKNKNEMVINLVNIKLAGKDVQQYDKKIYVPVNSL